jgi:hypothetical protein
MCRSSVLRTRCLRGLAGGAAEEGLAVELARDELQVQVDEGGELAHLGRRERVGRHERGLRTGRLQPVDDHLAFAQRALGRADEGDLAQRRGGEHGLVLRAGGHALLLEGQALFQQDELDLVVVVGNRKAAQGDHGEPFFCRVGWEGGEVQRD